MNKCDLCNAVFDSGDDRIGNVWIDNHYLTSCLECEENQRELGKTVVYRKLRPQEQSNADNS
jgi:hypothetical protein